MSTPTLAELKTLIKEEGLKIQVRNNVDPVAVLEKIRIKREELASGADEGASSGAEEDNLPTPENNAGSTSKSTKKGKKLLSVNSVQKIIDAEGVNLRITRKLRGNLSRLNELLAERRKEA